MTKHNSYWQSLLAQYNARKISSLAKAKDYPFESVAIETKNFGYVFSAISLETGYRKVLARL